MRTWKPLSQRMLKLIIADAETDDPRGEWSPDDVYRLAREVEQSRDHDPTGDMIAANQGELLQKHREAVQLISRVMETQPAAKLRPLIEEILDRLGQFHPFYGETWPGWPEVKP